MEYAIYDAKDEFTLVQVAMLWCECEARPHHQDKSAEARALRARIQEMTSQLSEAAKTGFDAGSVKAKDLHLATKRKSSDANQTSTGPYATRLELRRYAEARKRYSNEPIPKFLMTSDERGAPSGGDR